MLLESAEAYWETELLDKVTWTLVLQDKAKKRRFYYPYSNFSRYVLVHLLEV